MKRVRIDRDMLYKLYIVEDLSYLEVSKKLNVSQTSICRLCKRYNIKKEIIHPKRIYKREKFGRYTQFDKDELYDLYIVQNKSAKELMKIYNVSEYTIKKALHYQGIKKDKAKAEEVFKRIIFETYGVDHYSKTDEFKKKLKETNLKHCGYESNFKDPKFIKATVEYNMNKYGVKNSSQREDVRRKAKETMLEKYGTDIVTSVPEIQNKIRETSKKRYGVDWYSKSEECKEKVRNTNLKHCGETSNMKTKEFKEQAKKTCIEKYGCECAMQSEEIKKKVLMTKKMNKTITKSSQEEKAFTLLIEKYKNVERQFRSEEYPFACDFYVPTIDLYIEYQGHFSHGNEPYDPSNDDHRKIVEKWKNKNKNSYNDAITVWTIRDPLKRETARKNNLNWIEFFNMNEFMEWYNEN